MYDYELDTLVLTDEDLMELSNFVSSITDDIDILDTDESREPIDLTDDLTDFILREDAATAIQAGYRGYKTRVHVKAWRGAWCVYYQNKYTTIIQAAYRGFICRQKLKLSVRKCEFIKCDNLLPVVTTGSGRFCSKSCSSRHSISTRWTAKPTTPITKNRKGYTCSVCGSTNHNKRTCTVIQTVEKQSVPTTYMATIQATLVDDNCVFVNRAEWETMQRENAQLQSILNLVPDDQFECFPLGITNRVIDI